MKEKYREPEMDILMLMSECVDVICASSDVELDYSGGGWTDGDVD